MLITSRLLRIYIFALFVITSQLMAGARVTERIDVSNALGTRHQLVFHKYGSKIASKKAYIQATLHADEIPGLLVNHHLLRMLDEAEKRGDIKESIVVVPYANPIGLSQELLGTHIGRFNLATGINFNREWPDLIDLVGSKVDGQLSVDDAVENVKTIRKAILAALDEASSNKEEIRMKQILYRESCDADIVLDLHCDSDAVLHMYTHDRLWPKLSDLAAFVGSHCHLLASESGGSPFDEVSSCLWAKLSDRFSGFPIPMACESATIELRGELSVSDEYALQDAKAIYRFLQHRGYITQAATATATTSEVPALKRDASPLTGVDMVEAPVAGVVVWRVKPGDMVKTGTLLGEIVSIDDVDAPRTPLVSRTDGIVFGKSLRKLVRPGEVVIKIAGERPLDWRKGNLLTA